MRVGPARPDRQSRLIESIYDCVFDQERWPSLLDTLTGYLDGVGGTLLVRRKPVADISFAVASGVALEGMAQYEEYYYSHDIWEMNGRRQAKGDIFWSDTMMRRDCFEASEFRNDFLQSMRIDDGLFACVGHDDREQGVLAIYGEQRQWTAGGTPQSMLAPLVPHLSHAVAMTLRHTALSQVREGLEVASRGLGPVTGLVVVAGDGKVLFVDGVAQNVLDRHARLSVRHGYLTTDDPGIANLLQRDRRSRTSAAEDAGFWPSRRMVDDPIVGPMVVETLPLSEARFSRGGTALLLTAPDLNREARSVARVASLYAFTPAEERVAQALLDGLSVDAIAIRHDTARGTVRNQVKALLGKTGTRRQSELVSELARLGGL